MAGGPEESAVLNALPDPVLVVGDSATIHYANQAAEQFFQLGAAYLRQRTLADLIAADSPLLRMIEQARRDYASLCSGEVEIDSPRTGLRLVTAQVSLLSDAPLRQVVMLHERTVAMQIDRQLIHRHAARSVSGLAAVLAHEVKNPLSGIRGAAQLLEQGASEGDRELTTLIRDEADRIVALVDRMEVFSDNRPVDKTAVNIHRVLEHVRRVAQTGFAGHVRFVEQYDPSLPPVLGNRDQLIQVFLNLVKNAAEAVPAQGGEVLLSTAYRHGVRLAIAGQDQQQLVPLVVTVQDNGSGITEDVRDHLFEAFVTTKKKGQGLGLALVAKIVGDHGGLIDVDSQPRRTQVRVLLPMVTDGG